MKPELLAPCGSQEALVAAVAAGADAVYLSGIRFGARKSATNFDHKGIEDAVRYAHGRGVRVYCTVNTLVKDIELLDFIEWTDHLYEVGVDALILQDIGMVHVIKDRYPGMELHGSTQMSAHHVADFKYLESIGLDRVVAAREMSSKEIAELKKQTDLDVEVFFHGALCVCYSGQCLMSSLIGGRSGNRGACAQSCRQLYTSEDGNGASYRLSTKDLELLSVLSLEILENVHSIKIEGRMKRPEYVYTITSAYRKAIDGLYLQKNAMASGDAIMLDQSKILLEESRKLLEENKRIFNRGGSAGLLGTEDRHDAIDDGMPGNRGVRIGNVHQYDMTKRMLTIKTREGLKVNDEILVRTKGHIHGARVETINQSPNGQGVVIPFKHQVVPGDEIYRVTDDALLMEVRERYRVENPRFELNARLIMGLDRPASLIISSSDLSVEVCGTKMVEKALKSPTSHETALTQLSKMGGTPYTLAFLDIQNDEGGVLPASELNALRRAALEALDHQRHMKLSKMDVRNDIRLQAPDYTSTSDRVLHGRSDRGKLYVSVKTVDQLEAVKDAPIRGIYCELSEDMIDRMETLTKAGINHLIPRLPRILDAHVDYGKMLTRISKMGLGRILVGSYGGVHLAKSYGFKPVPDWSLNVFNIGATSFYKQSDADAATLSYELNESEIEALAEGSDLPLEIVIFGRQEAMVMKHCINPCSQATCKLTGKCHVNRTFWLKDKMDARFEAIQHDGLTTLFNSAYLSLCDELFGIERMGISRFRLEFSNETPEFIKKMVELHLEILSGNLQVQSKVRAMADKYYGLPATKGHFKRGIQ